MKISEVSPFGVHEPHLFYPHTLLPDISPERDAELKEIDDRLVRAHGDIQITGLIRTFLPHLVDVDEYSIADLVSIYALWGVQLPLSYPLSFLTAKQWYYDRNPVSRAKFILWLKKTATASNQLSDVATLFGKITTQVADQEWFRDKWLRSKVEKWLLRPVAYSSMFLDELFAIVDSLITCSRPKGIDFQTFCAEPGLWATQGSTSRRHRLQNFDRSVFKRNKATLAFLDTQSYYDDAMDLLTKEDPNVKFYIRPFIKKDEPAGIRLVALVDDLQYLLSSYALYGLDLSSFEWAPLLSKSNYHEIIGRCLADGRYAFAGDFSAFDNQLPLSILHYIRKKIFRMVQDWTTSQADYLAWVFTYNNWLKLGDEEFLITNGLPSGDRLTTLVNSIFNMALQTFALRRLSIVDAVVFVAGDDSLILSKSPIIQGIPQILEQHNVLVSKHKSTFSRDSCEFLKQHYFYDRSSTTFNVYTRGPEYRGYSALVWKPTSKLNLQEAINRRVDAYQKMFSRYVARHPEVYTQCVETALVDFYYSFSGAISKKSILMLASIPTALGGFGLLPPVAEVYSSWDFSVTEKVTLQPNEYVAALHTIATKAGNFKPFLKRLFTMLSDKTRIDVGAHARTKMNQFLQLSLPRYALSLYPGGDVFRSYGRSVVEPTLDGVFTRASLTDHTVNAILQAEKDGTLELVRDHYESEEKVFSIADVNYVLHNHSSRKVKEFVMTHHQSAAVLARDPVIALSRGEFNLNVNLATRGFINRLILSNYNLTEMFADLLYVVFFFSVLSGADLFKYAVTGKLSPALNVVVERQLSQVPGTFWLVND